MIPEFSANIFEIIDSLGYFGIFLGMVIVNSFIPLPSEVILIPVGILISQGEMSFTLAFIFGLFGSLVGATINYLLALFLGRNTVDILISKYGKFFFITKKRLDETDEYFKRHGEITTFIGRLIPGVRHLISLPAGFAKMNFYRFAIAVMLGSGIWVLTLLSLGYFLGNNIELINKNIEIITITFVLIAFIMLFAYVSWIKKKRKSKHR